MGNQWSVPLAIAYYLLVASNSITDGFVIHSQHGRHISTSVPPYTAAATSVRTSELHIKGYMDSLDGPPVTYRDDDFNNNHNINHDHNINHNGYGSTLDLLADSNPNNNNPNGDNGPLPVADMDKVDNAMRMIEASLMDSVDDAIKQIEAELKGSANDAINTIVGEKLYDDTLLTNLFETKTTAPPPPPPPPSTDNNSNGVNMIAEEQRAEQLKLQHQAQAAKLELQKQQQELLEAREAHKALIADEERIKREKLIMQEERAAVEAAARKKQEEYFAQLKEAARIETQRAEEKKQLSTQAEDLKFEEMRKAEEARKAKEEYLARVAEAARLGNERKQQEQEQQRRIMEEAHARQLQEAARLEQEHKMEEERLAKEAEELRQKQQLAKEEYMLHVAKVEQQKKQEQQEEEMTAARRLAEEALQREELLHQTAQAERAALNEALQVQKQQQTQSTNNNSVEDYLRRVAEAQSLTAAKLEEQRLEHERLAQERERLATETEAHALEATRLEQERLAKEMELAQASEAARLERERMDQAREDAAKAAEIARLEQEQQQQAQAAAEASRMEEERRQKEEEMAYAAQAAKLQSELKEGEYRVAKEAYLARRVAEMDEDDELSIQQFEALQAAEDAKLEADRLKNEAEELRVNAKTGGGMKIKDMPPQKEAYPPVLASKMGLAEKEKSTQKKMQEELDSESPLEERLSKMVSSTIEGSLTNQKSKFLDTKNSLKDTKRRTQKRIVRGMYEREKAAERIAELKAKMDQEMNIINLELEEVLMEVQKKIDTELYRISELFKDAIGGEVNRQTLISSLIELLCRAIETKEEEINAEMKITMDMKNVLSALKEGTISENLYNLVEIREKVCSIDEALLADLNDCVRELELILEDSKERQKLLEVTFEGVMRPEACTAEQEEWADSLDHMETVLDIAAVNVETAENKIQFLKTRIEDALVNKSVVLGEPLPKSFQQRGQQNIDEEQMYQQEMAQQHQQQQMQPFDCPEPKYSIDTFQDMDEMDVLHIMGTSIGNAAVGGTRMTLLGLRAILDSVTDDGDNYQDGQVDINAPRPPRRHMSESSRRAVAEARKAAQSVSDALSAALSLTIKSANHIGNELKHDPNRLLKGSSTPSPAKPKKEDDDLDFDSWRD